MSAPRRRRVLIADDDAMLREIATAMLENAGYEVLTAASGDAALAACAARMPDIALLDVEMAGGDGYQACANIRALPGSASVPVVMITGLEDPQSIERAYQAGATDFMIKPLNWPLLVRRIEYVLRGARTVDALRHSEEKNAALLKLMPDGLFLVDAQGVITQRFSATRGLMRRRAVAPGEASRLVDFLPAAVHATAMERLVSAARGSAAAFEFSLGSRRRGVRHFECRLMPKSSGEVLVVLRDVTQRKDSEGRMRRLAYVDALTGLPNREWIKTYLGRALARGERRRATCAVLFVDLDGFKRVNDTLGHETGDALLAQVAGRLRSALGYCRRRSPGDAPEPAPPVSAQLARLGGDEFIAVLTGEVTPQAAEQAARSIRDELNAKFALAGYEVSVTPSIGIALSPQHGRDAKVLLKNADEAMYLAKASGRNQFRFYDDTLRARAMLRSALELDLRAALGTPQLQVYYQPQYDTRSLQIVGAEALVRWVHPERGPDRGGRGHRHRHRPGRLGAVAGVRRPCGVARPGGAAQPPVAEHLGARVHAAGDAAAGEHRGRARRHPGLGVRAGGERGGADARCAGGAAHAALAQGAGVRAGDGRLRLRPVLVQQPQAAAAGHAQDRRLVRGGDRQGPGQPRHRARHHRAQPQAQHARGRQGGLCHLAAAVPARRGLRPGAGVPAEPRGRGRPVREAGAELRAQHADGACAAAGNRVVAGAGGAGREALKPQGLRLPGIPGAGYFFFGLRGARAWLYGS
ncbi:MAG TPA: diguanylate cyclase, partial [Steroidobacteraceae bacterium]|nr:diguanylate cyclase [Steroidobacteraceae bacterium]